MASLTIKQENKFKSSTVMLHDANVLDNKYLYEKSNLHRLEATHDDHPLKAYGAGDIIENIDTIDVTSGVEEINKDLESVALDWKTLRNIKECGCSTPFDHFSRKVIITFFYIIIYLVMYVYC